MENVPTNLNPIPKKDFKDPKYPVPGARETMKFQNTQYQSQMLEASEYEKSIGFDQLKPGQSLRDPRTGNLITKPKNTKYVNLESLNFKDHENYLGYTNITGQPRFIRSQIPEEFGLLRMIGSVQSSTTPFKPNDPYLLYQQEMQGSKLFFYV